VIPRAGANFTPGGKTMSWSVAVPLGRAPAVRAAVAKQFEQGGKCTEPEETIRQAAAKIIDAALAAQDPSKVVEVIASGSMSSSAGKVDSNSLSIKIEPKWGFLE
jgi:hypothetical protein